MRILVTKQGNIIIQEIDDTMPLYTQNLSSTSRFRGYSTDYQQRKLNKSGINNFSKANNIFKQSPSRSVYGSKKLEYRKKYQNLEDTEITKENLQKAKQIKINEHKITFPKQFAEKYENDILNANNSNIINSSSNNVLPPLSPDNHLMTSNLDEKNKSPTKNNNQYNNINTTSNNSIMKKEQYLTLKEIIPNSSLYQMKKKILKEKKIRDRATVITENDFRSAYKPETDLQRFNDILMTSRVNSNKSNLIKYLNERKIAPLTIKILADQDSDKISKINKICQTIFRNQDKEKLFYEIVKNKARQRINNTKKEFQMSINGLGSNMTEAKEKLKKYEKSIDKKEKYREYFNDVVIHHWMKRDLERFNKKSTPKPKYMEPFVDGIEDDNSRK
jgi:hypothetical protein